LSEILYSNKPQQVFHPLTRQNTIKAFKFRAQAIFSLLEKTLPWFTKFEFEKFFSIFYLISTQRSYIDQRLDTNGGFAKLRAISNLFSFFLYTLYNYNPKCLVTFVPFYAYIIRTVVTRHVSYQFTQYII
jgi:hypothetical protein